MAKGNDGHVLQHGLLCAIATRVAASGSLLFIDTHAMAPSETWESRSPRGKRLQAVLARVDAPNSMSRIFASRYFGWLRSLVCHREVAYVKALRRVSESGLRLAEEYPSSLVLIHALVPNVHGLVCERDAEKARRISDWLLRVDSNSVKVDPRSWRRRLGVSVDPIAPANVFADDDAPWILSMDPYTYREGAYTDRNDYGGRDSADLFADDILCDNARDLRTVVIGRATNPTTGRFRAGTLLLFTYAMNDAKVDHLHDKVNCLVTRVAESTRHRWQLECRTLDLRSGHADHKHAHACAVHPCDIKRQVSDAFREYESLLSHVARHGRSLTAS